MIRYQVPVEDPRFGKLFRCPNNPREGDTSLQNRLRQVGNMSALAHKTFDTFEVSLPTYTEDEQTALNTAWRTAMQFAEKPQGWIVLAGKYGSGKTHLAAAIANARLAYGEMVIFITTPDLLDYLRSAYAPNAETTYDSLFERVKNAQLLILDDLGVENPSQWAQEKLFQLLNYRYVTRMPTVITTNVDLERIDGRIRSRMLDADLTSVLKMDVPDYRTALRNRHVEIQTDLSRYKNMTFETFILPTDLASQELTLLRSAFYATQEFSHTPQWLVVSDGGRMAQAKPILAVATAFACRNNGMDVTFITTPDLLDYLRETFHPSSPARFDERFQAVKNTQVLILDNFDMTNASSWAREKIFQILDYRYVSQMPTVITSAIGVAQQDERIRTRLMDDRLCAIEILAGEAYTTRRRRQR